MGSLGGTVGYSILGKLVWRLGRRHLRRRYQALGRNAVLAGGGLVLLGGAGAAVAATRSSPRDRL